MPQPELIALAKQIAAQHKLYPELVCAVCEQESAWMPWAIRYEAGFYAKYVQSIMGISATEAQARATSWGLMQVMGQVAREFGFGGPSLAELCDPKIGLSIGCAVLAHKLAVASDNVEQALLLWNGGGNPEYPAEVLARAEKYK